MFILFATTFTSDDYGYYIKKELKEEYHEDDPRMAIMDTRTYGKTKDWKQTLKMWVDP